MSDQLSMFTEKPDPPVPPFVPIQPQEIAEVALRWLKKTLQIVHDHQREEELMRKATEAARKKLGL